MAGGSEQVLIVGAGTMGAGIAQVAATHGWTVHLRDVDPETVQQAINGIGARFDRLVEKERLTSSQRDEAIKNLHATPGRSEIESCELIIEAIVEDADVKVKALEPLIEPADASAIFATNTSSLSVTKLGQRLGIADRFAGMHFFNPAPLLQLVEVIAGVDTQPHIIERLSAIATSWGKKVARATDVPGFIVNHVARPYYLEAFRILEDGLASVEEIDDAMKTLGGFRMGPLELTDLIGQDVNAATTRSVWNQLGQPPLLHPSRLQEQLVEAGDLGRKTGRGVYDYSDDVSQPAIDIKPAELAINVELQRTVDQFVERAADGRPASDRARYCFARILIALIAQAVQARDRGVASEHDIDTALRYGTNYPHGPFEWAHRIGWDRCTALLEKLNENAGDDRFAQLTNSAHASS